MATDWDLEQHHLRLLTLAAEAWDDKRHAREQIRKEGMTGDDAIWRATAATLSRPPSSCWRGGHAVAGRSAKTPPVCGEKQKRGVGPLLAGAGRASSPAARISDFPDATTHTKRLRAEWDERGRAP